MITHKMEAETQLVKSLTLKPAQLFVYKDDLFMHINMTDDGMLVKSIRNDSAIVIGKNEDIEIIKSLEMSRI